MQRHRVSIILPAYNEEALLEAAIQKAVQWCTTHTRHWEIIVIENGSTDATLRIAKRLAKADHHLRVIHLKQPSFGRAVKKGINAAHFRKTVLLNVDWIDPHFISEAVMFLDTTDVVVGSKVLNRHADHRPWHRKLLSSLLNYSLRHFFDFTGTDSHGLKAFRTRVAQSLVLQCSSSEIIETELLLRAQHQRYRIVEVPVEIRELRPPRQGLLSRGIRVIRELIALHKALQKNPLRSGEIATR